MARLGELLVAAGLLTTDQVDRALRAQVMWGARLGTNLIELGFIDLDTLSTVLAQQHGLPAALARHFERVDRDLQRSLHADVAEMYTVLPLVRVRDRDIVLASSSPLTKKAQARIADELAVEPEHIISAIAAELRMRYQLERVYNIQRPARFMRSPGKTIPPFPVFDVDEAESIDEDLLEVEVEAPAGTGDVKSTEPFLATYTAPPARTPSIPPPTLEHKKPVPTVDEMAGVDIDMDDSSARVPAAKPASPIGNLPYTTPSLPVPGVEPVVLKPRTADVKTGVAVPTPPSTPIPTRIPASENEIATVPVSKLDEREVSLEGEAPVRPSAPIVKAEPGFVKPVPSAKPKPEPPKTKWASVAKFDAIAAEDSALEAAIPEVVTDAQTRPASVPSIAKPLVIAPKADAPKRDDETKPATPPPAPAPAPVPVPSVPRPASAIPSIVPKKNQTTPGVVVPRPPAKVEPVVAKPEPATPAAGKRASKSTEVDAAWGTEDPKSALFAGHDAGAPDGATSDAIPRPPRAPTEDSGAIAIPVHNLADLDALSAEVDDALSIPEAVDDDRSSGRERRRYVRTITDTPSESERSHSLGRIAIRRLAIAAAPSEADGNTLGQATRAIRRATNRDRVAELCVDTLFRFAPSCAAASLMVVRGQVATTWKGFIRDGSTPPEIAVPLDQPGLIPKAVHRNTTVRAPSTDLGPIDQLLMVSLAQKTGDMVIVPISIAKQVMCVIALVTDTDAPIATAESVAAGAGAAFARLMRDASR